MGGKRDGYIGAEKVEGHGRRETCPRSIPILGARYITITVNISGDFDVANMKWKVRYSVVVRASSLSFFGRSLRRLCTRCYEITLRTAVCNMNSYGALYHAA